MKIDYNAPFAPGSPAPIPRDHYVMAVVSLILGILSLGAWLLPICGLPMAATGLVLGIVGRESSRRGMATTGLVMSVISLILGIGSAAIGAYLGTTGQLFGAFPPPTSTPLPTHVPTKIKTPTAQASNCIHWSQISTSMEGRKICIYGKVESIYKTNETSTRIKFTSQPNSFFLYNVNFIYPDLKVGDCVLADEVLQLYDNKIPYMEISALYKCEPWMK
jgi:hypothetical protein